MSDGEEFYDLEISPVLRELAMKCQVRGIPFMAAVQYDGEDFAETKVCLDGSDLMLMAYYALKARGNIDALAMGWARMCREKGRAHNSIVLHSMGVPHSPAET